MTALGPVSSTSCIRITMQGIWARPRATKTATKAISRPIAQSHGRMVAWSHGRMVAWSHGRMVAWSHGRMVASPVTFGSLPSTSQANAPSTTLLFRPTPPTNSITRKSPERNHSNITTNTVSLPFDNLPIERENLHSTSSSSDEVLLIGRCLTS
jgi:hypothetical protein